MYVTCSWPGDGFKPVLLASGLFIIASVLLPLMQGED